MIFTPNQENIKANTQKVLLFMKEIKSKLSNSDYFLKVYYAINVFGFFISFLPFGESLFYYHTINLLNLQILNYPIAAIVEPNILMLAMSIVSSFYAFHMIEGTWKKKEIIKFALMIHTTTTILIGITIYLIYRITDGEVALLDEIINGLVPISAALFVPIKQFLPDVAIFTTPFGRIKNTHLPFCCIFFTLLFYLIGFVRYVCIFQTTFAIQLAWIYLRFYQENPNDNTTTGDLSDHFAWHTLFPRIAHKPLIQIGNVCYNLMIKLNLYKPVVLVDVNAMSSVPLTGIVPSDPVEAQRSRDAERRRQKALNDLKARLAKNKVEKSINISPSQDETETLESVKVDTSKQIL
uniref:7TM_GPCR_Srx domain-containing protein n=1 Tax=Parastrongyloides trichosuri TaxID=131310 RepID=A0A0N4ZCA6_PARTI